MQAQDLSAPEILVLLEPEVAADEVLKVALKELIARGLLRVDNATPGGESHFVLDLDNQPQNPVLQSLWAHLRSASRQGLEINRVLQHLQREYGLGYGGFKAKTVLPSLVERGLLHKESGKFLGLFPYTNHRLTPDGADLKSRLKQGLLEARRLVPSLADGKAEAVALLGGLGAGLLLLPGIESQLQQLRTLMGGNSSDGYVPIFVVDESDHHDLERAFQQVGVALDAGDGGATAGAVSNPISHYQITLHPGMPLAGGCAPGRGR
ncbi:hypothetical protein Mrub_1856 [Meiothermus ruber DSM 1279]|uniref:Uncharacterized protein n=1 Tax=Meiothermus ruber (strain ATCC 35948 / DSM 1279 / VKM B-1258 / 21) TaxID=504728 RepID=D3PT30_MEIRD|nr:hypothetical protein Mrub_1856 [Meiothermus ruber DSM 1279]AGK05942.1 hypothetical protein K649_13280 [Meiothermus ruber DSM 1279]MCL6530257.1 GPP34 family phosphoprotein [Meiothermus ruber]GAO75574.1 putative uncharacterized protein [Meiothermus ruber H328]